MAAFCLMLAMKRVILSLSLIAFLPSCAEQSFFMAHEDAKPAYAQSGSSAKQDADARAPLDLPPELRADLELPMSERVASRANEAELPRAYAKAVAGKAVSLDARVYQQTPAEVFSAVVDAMTGMNAPIQSVDSPSGIITTDWIRKGNNSLVGMAGMMGLGDAPKITRHRFIVRVYRARMDSGDVTKLEVRVLGQAIVANQWVNKPFKRKVADEIFEGVNEQLTRVQRQDAVKP